MQVAHVIKIRYCTRSRIKIANAAMKVTQKSEIKIRVHSYRCIKRNLKDKDEKTLMY